MVNGERRSRSTGEKNKDDARKKEKKVKAELKREIESGAPVYPKCPVSRELLLDKFIDSKEKQNDPVLSKNTISNYKYSLRKWINSDGVFPSNKNTAVTLKGNINVFHKWVNDVYGKDLKIYPNKGHAVRLRVYGKQEKNLILENISDCDLKLKKGHGTAADFQDLVRFAYYTGARRDELLHIEPVSEKLVQVTGKSWRRLINLNSQAKNVLDSRKYLWSEIYRRPDYISRKFQIALAELGIQNGIFHDLRRTFGYDLLMKGISIWQVSKLLGHKDVATTERHYAPFFIHLIDDYTLQEYNN
jgi:integrase